MEKKVPSTPDSNDSSRLSNATHLQKEIEQLNQRLRLEDALETVRAKAMAMQDSSDLTSVVREIFVQLQKLGLDAQASDLMIFDQEGWGMELYVSGAGGAEGPYRIPQSLYDHPHHRATIQAWRKGDSQRISVLEGDQFDQFFDIVFSRQEGLKSVPAVVKKKVLAYGKIIHTEIFTRNAGIRIASSGWLSKEQLHIEQRFAQVFEQAYVRFLDLKKAEAQAREAQIELALEQIRATSLAMRKSEEIREVVSCVFERLKDLGFDLERAAAIILVFIDGSKDHFEWITDPTQTYPQRIKMPYLENALISDIMQARETGIDFYSKIYSIKEKNAFFKYVFANTAYNQIPDFKKQELLKAKTYSYSAALEKSSALAIPDMTGKIYLGESEEIMKRFAKTFDQAHIRFLDLQKAEEQAREAQIEAALERVRGRSLSMQKSEELPQVAEVMINQMTYLGLEDIGFAINIAEDNQEEYVLYSADPVKSGAKRVLTKTAKLSINATSAGRLFLQKIAKGEKDFTIVGGKEQIAEIVQFRESFERQSTAEAVKLLDLKKVYHHFSLFHGISNTMIITSEPLPNEFKSISRRFANVFGQSFRRFLDLQKAESQAREAEIQLALERVRARTMAMQKSEELGKVATTLYTELQLLGFADFVNCGFIQIDEANNIQKGWGTVPGTEPQPFFLPLGDEPVTWKRYQSWKKGDPVLCQEVGGARLKRHIEYAMPHLESVEVEQMVKTQFTDPTYFYSGNFSHGYLFVVSTRALEKDQLSLIPKFTKAFELAYRRFLDLQKAEEQAREAQIETALERVRSRTMAMHASDELREVVAEFFCQVQLLGIEIQMFVIFIFKPDDRLEWWGTEFGEEGLPQSYDIPPLTEFNNHSRARNLMEIRKNKTPYQVFELSGQEKKSWDHFLLEKTGLKKLPADIKKGMRSLDKIFLCDAVCHHGILEVAGQVALSNEHAQILQRFTKVFEQTYTRFLDVQNAEAQAREAQIEAALERVRAKTMAMQKSEELRELVFEYYKQIHPFGFAKWGFEIKIANEDKSGFFCWISPPGARVQPEGFNIPTLNHWVLKKYWSVYEQQIPITTIVNAGADKRKLAVLLLEKSDMKNLPEEVKTNIMETEYVHFSIAAMRFGLLKAVDMEPVLEKDFSILQRFAKVFEQTYTRFLDLQKAEAQAREAQIEAALERVRAASMAMHRSKDLHQVINVVYNQLADLGLTLHSAQILDTLNDKHALHVWNAGVDQPYPKQVHIPATRNVFFTRFYDAIKNDESFYTQILSKRQKDDVFKHYFKNAKNVDVPKARQDFIFSSPGMAMSVAIGKDAVISIVRFDASPYPPVENEILKRFGQVFDQSYTRFLDLQNAEAQAREAQIEASLERVRAASLAIHKSEELHKVVLTVSQEIKSLGLNIDAAHIYRFVEGDKGVYMWIAGDGGIYPYEVYFPYIKHEIFDAINDARIKQENFISPVVNKREFNRLYHHLIKSTKIEIPEDRQKFVLDAKSAAYSVALEKHSGIGLLQFSQEEAGFSLEENEILKRLSKVFEQAFTRFLDLQKAEAQARDAQIEASLERVRAASMAMHQSDELADVSQVLFTELRKFYGELWACGFVLCEKEKIETEHWMSVEAGKLSLAKVPSDLDHIHQFMYDTWASKRELDTIVIEGAEIEEHYKVMSGIPDLQENIDQALQERIGIPSWQQNFIAPFSRGYILIVALAPISNIEVLPRMAKVFEQTYTRFLDLQKAEAQAREAQIEAALERVRAEAMAMHNSENLQFVVATIFAQFKHLELNTLRCGIGIIDAEKKEVEVWTTTQTEKGLVAQVSGRERLQGHQLLVMIFKHWQQQQLLLYRLEGSELMDYYLQTYNKKFIESLGENPTEIKHHYLCAFFPAGGLYVFKENEFNEAEIKMVQRFADVFHLAYTRYEDLQKAEIRTREAIKSASLDRVRAVIASMRTSGDLQKITPLIWQELTTLEVPFFRCGVFIMDEDNRMIQVFLSNPVGAALAALAIPYGASELTNKSVEYWRKQMILKEEWDRLQFLEWSETMVSKGYLQSNQNYTGGGDPPDHLALHFIPFSQGMLYIGNSTQLSDDQLQIVKDLADAFSVAYARYEDFNRLENTLSELKATQAQLIQSEKMASLGELTAGIAHEIQNPLNFVNNFSEVSNELIEEAKAELEKGDLSEAKELMTELIQNLEKINHHGQRASDIVKGMLDHSRTSAGEKIVTDLNNLCDEYLRLAYHGMRAKDKSFNVEIKTDLDPDLPRINVVPQDVGRVILNLINNAFQACAERSRSNLAESSQASNLSDLTDKKSNAEHSNFSERGDQSDEVNLTDFQPLVSVSTKFLHLRGASEVSPLQGTEGVSGVVQITISDNGPGIPDEIGDKIFQPFFTTKPTGQGTGLGLSLSYDIVKAHGGEIKVESEKGKGSTFIIQLPIG